MLSAKFGLSNSSRDRGHLPNSSSAGASPVVECGEQVEDRFVGMVMNKYA